ncbi:hypothetical protein ISR94_01115 [Candidatus Microgenomates bacterium]|nr:hypothetical protein [Candidatus Microgenomates bacterium]
MRRINKKIEIAIKPYYGKMFLENKIFDHKVSHNPFYGLRRKLQEKGIEINTIDKIKNPKYYFYCDIPYPWELKTLYTMIKNRKKNILFTFESPIANPINNIKLFHLFFKKIYTWNDKFFFKRDPKYKKFFFPQDIDKKVVKQKPFSKKKLLVMINSNKKSIFLYKLFVLWQKDQRYKIAHLLSQYIEDDFDLYGKGWDISSKSYKGKYRGDKIKKLSKYKFCICFENSSSPGYITEKIFDCFVARCVPVYLGPSNIGKYIPLNTFVDFSKFKNHKNLIEFLNSMGKDEHEQYINNAKIFISKKETKDKWSRKSFEDILVKESLE